MASDQVYAKELSSSESEAILHHVGQVNILLSPVSFSKIGLIYNLREQSKTLTRGSKITMNCHSLAALASLLPPDGHEFGGEMFDLSRVFEDEFDYDCDNMLAPRPITPTSIMPSPTGV